MEDKSKKRARRLLIVLILLLLLIIILVLVSNQYLVQIDVGNHIGNTIVNEIGNNISQVDKNVIVPGHGGKPNKPGPENKPGQGETPVIPPEEDEEPPEGDNIGDIENNPAVIPDVYAVISENTQWAEVQKINLFENKYYFDSIIAPGVSGEYEFIVSNGLDKKAYYSIQFEETNNKNINMKYKLKLGEQYLVDEWTDIEDILLPIFEIDADKRGTYTLEWKWIDSENDTEIGQAADTAIYNLVIRVVSEVYN